MCLLGYLLPLLIRGRLVELAEEELGRSQPIAIVAALQPSLNRGPNARGSTSRRRNSRRLSRCAPGRFAFGVARPPLRPSSRMSCEPLCTRQSPSPSSALRLHGPPVRLVARHRRLRSLTEPLDARFSTLVTLES
jgi:hypothetical protein